MIGCDFGLTALSVRVRSGFSPAQLAGLAAWYDPSDLTTLFQDVGMTVPVTAAGQAVAALRDKSGNAAHLTQSVAAARPIYQTDGVLHWLQFDGLDDVLNAPVPVAAYPFEFDCAATGSVYEGGYLSLFGDVASYKALMLSAGSYTLKTVNRTQNTPFDQVTRPMTAQGGFLRGFFDGAQIGVQFDTTLSVMPSSYPWGAPVSLKMGAVRANLFLPGNIYQAAVFARVLPTEDVERMRLMFRAKMGLGT